MGISRNDERGLLPVIITTVVVLLPLAFVLGAAVGSYLQGASVLEVDTLSAWVTAAATVAIAVLTFVLAKETWYLREAQIQQLEELKRENIRPNISVQLESSPVGMHFMNVKVANFGKGIARNLRFSFHDRDGGPVELGDDIVVDKLLKLAIFRQGIAAVGIGQVISSFVFSFLDLQKELDGAIFRPYVGFRVTFEDVEGNAYQNEYPVDFAQYEGITEVGGDALHAIAGEMKKLREKVDRIAGRPGGKLGVDEYTSEDRRAERQAMVGKLGPSGPDS